METFNNLGEERVEQEEDSLEGELENYLIVGAQVLTGCLGPGATLVVTELYRFQVSGSGCLRNSFHLMTLYSRKHYGLEYILDPVLLFMRSYLSLPSQHSSKKRFLNV